MPQEAKEVTVQEIAAFLYNTLQTNPTVTVPAAQSEYMSAAKQWLHQVANTEPKKDTPEGNQKETEDS